MCLRGLLKHVWTNKQWKLPEQGALLYLLYLAACKPNLECENEGQLKCFNKSLDNKLHPITSGISTLTEMTVGKHFHL